MEREFRKQMVKNLSNTDIKIVGLVFYVAIIFLVDYWADLNFPKTIIVNLLIAIIWQIGRLEELVYSKNEL